MYDKCVGHFVCVCVCARARHRPAWAKYQMSFYSNTFVTPTVVRGGIIKNKIKYRKKTNCLIFRWILDAKFAYWPCWKDRSCETSGTILAGCTFFSVRTRKWTLAEHPQIFIQFVLFTYTFFISFVLAHISLWRSNALFYVCKWHDDWRDTQLYRIPATYMLCYLFKN